MMVTYLPRLLPFLLAGDRKIPEKLQRFLKYMPAAALGALLFPGSMESIPGEPLAVIAGISSAAVSAFFMKGLLGPVIISLCATVGALWLG